MSDENLKKQLDLVSKNTILEVVHGSFAYGTNIASSDVDIKGICILPDLRYYFGMQTFEQQDGGWGQDKVIYDLRKFISLASACNPNILEVLFGDDSDIIKITPEGKKLRENRNLFLSRKARHTFCGYSHAQLKRMEGHKRWLDNTVSKPSRADFEHERDYIIGPLGTELPSGAKILSICDMTHDDLSIYKEADSFEGWKVIKCKVFDKSAYESVKKDYDNYTTWKANRNKARAELERLHGIDLKHAMHLVRLLKMGYEIITEGKVIVKRPDCEELLSIRAGAWSYAKILDYSAEMEQKIKEAEDKSPLPWSADYKAIEDLQIEILQSVIKDSLA